MAGFETGRQMRGISFDNYTVIPAGIARIPINARPDLDYKNATRAEITAQNTQLAQGERRFFGNPHGFPSDTMPLTPIYGGSVVTIKNPANYFLRGSLVVASNRPRPSAEEIAQHADQRIDTVFITELTKQTRDLFAANFLGAFQAAVDIADADHNQITPIGIVHHTPVTNEIQIPFLRKPQGIPYPRSVSFLHGTVGYVSSTDVVSDYTASTRVSMERRILTENVLVDLTGKLEAGLAEQGYDRDIVTVKPRREPNGVDIHLMDLTKSQLTTREGVTFSSDIFNAISLAYEQAYPSTLGNLPRFFVHDNTIFVRSPVPAHRQIFHFHDNHAVYGLIPVPIGTDVGGGEASNYKPERSVDYTYTHNQREEIDVFTNQVTRRVYEAVANIN